MWQLFTKKVENKDDVGVSWPKTMQANSAHLIAEFYQIWAQTR